MLSLGKQLRFGYPDNSPGLNHNATINNYHLSIGTTGIVDQRFDRVIDNSNMQRLQVKDTDICLGTGRQTAKVIPTKRPRATDGRRVIDRRCSRCQRIVIGYLARVEAMCISRIRSGGTVSVPSARFRPAA
jgi:hypothetical protein